MIIYGRASAPWSRLGRNRLAPFGAVLSDDYGSGVERTATLHPLWGSTPGRGSDHLIVRFGECGM